MTFYSVRSGIVQNLAATSLNSMVWKTRERDGCLRATCWQRRSFRSSNETCELSTFENYTRCRSYSFETGQRWLSVCDCFHHTENSFHSRLRGSSCVWVCLLTS